MTAPYWLGEPLPEEIWRRVRLRTVLDCCKWDVQSVDHCVLADFPLVIAESTWQELRMLAESLSCELTCAERELLGRKDLHVKLGLPKALRETLALREEPAVGIARVMRFDFHFTDDSWRISEVNADVPGGFIEASGFTKLVAAHYPGTTPPPDVAQNYADALSSALRKDAVVGLVHATAYSDDRQVMQFLAGKFAERGMRCVLVSPEHIAWEQNRAVVSSSFANEALDAIVRFFPAEWMPALPKSCRWAPFLVGSRMPISNPATAILVQTKRFPLVWESLSTDLNTWRKLLPRTVCPSTVSNELNDWVVKPALGRVGEDVAIAGVTSEKKLRRVHKAAKRRPSEWIAQRKFTVVPVSNANGSYYPSVGVFTIDGTAAGAYARIGRKPLIDDEAQDVAVLIAKAIGEGA